MYWNYHFLSRRRHDFWNQRKVRTQIVRKVRIQISQERNVVLKSNKNISIIFKEIHWIKEKSTFWKAGLRLCFYFLVKSCISPLFSHSPFKGVPKSTSTSHKFLEKTSKKKIPQEAYIYHLRQANLKMFFTGVYSDNLWEWSFTENRSSLFLWQS